MVDSVSQDGIPSFGGGTLIADDLVLTSAQLIFDATKNISVKFGNWEDGELYEVAVLEAVAHPDYDPIEQLHDIGILRLAESVEKSECLKWWF